MHYVYVVMTSTDTQLCTIKVGETSNFANRLTQLKSEDKHDLTDVIGVVEVEDKVQALLLESILRYWFMYKCCGELEGNDYLRNVLNLYVHYGIPQEPLDIFRGIVDEKKRFRPWYRIV